MLQVVRSLGSTGSSAQAFVERPRVEELRAHESISCVTVERCVDSSIGWNNNACIAGWSDVHV
jgi:hypothetical protein